MTEFVETVEELSSSSFQKNVREEELDAGVVESKLKIPAVLITLGAHTPAGEKLFWEILVTYPCGSSSPIVLDKSVIFLNFPIFPEKFIRHSPH